MQYFRFCCIYVENIILKYKIKMKRFLTLLCFAAIALVSCDNSSKVDENYNKVKAGLDIYTVATATNSVSLDGAAVAFRLGVLLTEADYNDLDLKDGTDNDWDDLGTFNYPYNNKSYNIKYFLFGSDTDTEIKKAGDVFTIKYGLSKDAATAYSAGVLDDYFRKGEFVVNTHGVELGATDEQNPWTVTLGEEKVEYANSYLSSTAVKCVSVDIKVWADDFGHFRFSSSDYRASYTASSSIISDWDSEAELYIDGYADLASLLGSTYEYSVLMGTGGVTLSGDTMELYTAGVEDDTAHEDADPLTYTPSESLYTTISGTEIASFRGEDYNQANYPSPSVEVSWNKGKATVSYNGATYVF